MCCQGIEKWGGYADSMNRGIFRNLCYSQHFIFRRVKSIDISNMD